MHKVRSYVIGFAASVALTLIAFGLVAVDRIDYWAAALVILALAVVQLFVQLYYFLHLNDESRPRLKLQTFFAAALVVLAVVFGSLWIMQQLSKYHGHDVLDEDIDSYIQNEEGIYKEPKVEN